MPITDLEHAQLRVEHGQLKLQLLEAQSRIVQLQHTLLAKELEQATKDYQALKEQADAQVDQTLNLNGHLREQS
jgi:uncharacterized protein YycO